MNQCPKCKKMTLVTQKIKKAGEQEYKEVKWCNNCDYEENDKDD